MTGRSWTITLARGGALLHTTDLTDRAFTAEITRSLGSAVLAGASDAGLPPLTRAHVTAEYRPPPPRTPSRPGRTHRHAHVPTLFATAETVRPSADVAVTALVEAGLLPAGPAGMTGPVMRLGETTPGSQLVLHIREDA